MKPEIQQLLENLEFHESQDKPGLWYKNLSPQDTNGKLGNITAYIDFRRARDKGHRFYTVEGIEGILDADDDVDLVPTLQYFKQERDKILGVNLPENPKKKGLVVSQVTEIAKTYGIAPELANLFFMKFDDGLYIKNPGLLHLASKKGYSRIDITSSYNETTQEWESECKIYPKLTKHILDGIGQLDKSLQKQALDFVTSPTNGTGRASKDNVKMSTMHKFLKEMAQTRACNRALRNFTGYGGTSYEELPEGQTEVRGD